MTILNIDAAFEVEIPPTVHGCSAMDILNKSQQHTGKILFTAKHPIQIGDDIIFSRLETRGRVLRMVERAEFLAWEHRVFPGHASALCDDDLYFFEVSVD